jgi:hypothetical protein
MVVVHCLKHYVICIQISFTTHYQALRLTLSERQANQREKRSKQDQQGCVKMVNTELIAAPAHSLLPVLDHDGPRHRCCNRNDNDKRQGPGTTLDMEWLCHPSCPPPSPSTERPNPRVRVWEQLSSPSLEPLGYWSMEPSDTATSPRGRHVPPCVVHSWGPCPNPGCATGPMVIIIGPGGGGKGEPGRKKMRKVQSISFLLCCHRDGWSDASLHRSMSVNNGGPPES